MRYQAELVDEFAGHFGLTVYECDDALVRTGRSLFGDGLYVAKQDPLQAADLRLSRPRWTRVSPWLAEAGGRQAAWVAEVVAPAPEPCRPPPGPEHGQRRHPMKATKGGVPSRPFVASRRGSSLRIQLSVPTTPGRVLSPTPLSEDPVTAGSIYEGKGSLAVRLDTHG